MQEIEFNAFSNTFGNYIPASGSIPATYSTTVGCLNPPCATLTPAPDPNTGFTALLNTQVQFNWVASCNHFAAYAGCGITTNKYDFYYKASDNYCPLPADNYVNILLLFYQDLLIILQKLNVLINYKMAM